MQRALTGIKPTGRPHLGNWLGMVQPAIELQGRYDAYYFVADYHAMTSPTEADQLRAMTREIANTFLAFGLDADRAVLFRQSAVPEVNELAWILATVMPVGQLERGHAVKAARDGGHEVNVGTWFYPVLMAADILLYDAAVVPIGRDQMQHIEIARDLAIKVNFRYGEGTLVVPEAVIRDEVAQVTGLDGQKMSKSYNNTIPIWLDSKPLRKLVMKIVTDSKGVEDPKDPETDATFALYKAVATPEETAALREQYLHGGLGYGHAKEALFQVLDRKLEGPRERFRELERYPSMTDDVLNEGGRRARRAAHETLARVRERAGLT